MNSSQFNLILDQIKHLITQSNDFLVSDWDNQQEALDFFNQMYLDPIEAPTKEHIEKINFLFLPTGTLQELSISNGWADEFLKLASNWDKLQSL